MGKKAMAHPLVCLQLLMTMQLVDDVLAAAPSDDPTLHVMSMLLKSTRRAHDLTRLYEAASAQEPSNTDLLRGLFGAYVK